MTINQLNRITTKLISKGAGRRAVCVSKETFSHPLESDGATILTVVKAELEVFPIADEDGGTAYDSRWREKYSMGLLLQGGESGQAIMNANWINCADRLPSHFHSVLGWVTGGPLVAGDPFADRVSYDAEKKEWHQSTGMDDAIVPVSHWMPLPYPPFKPHRKFT